MKDVNRYKGYSGSVEFSAENQVFFGKIVGIRDLVSFEGETLREIDRSFKEAVDDYIIMCKSSREHQD
jgi:predicted HicB family RNase H-like nuclease